MDIRGSNLLFDYCAVAESGETESAICACTPVACVARSEGSAGSKVLPRWQTQMADATKNNSVDLLVYSFLFLFHKNLNALFTLREHR